MLVAKKYIYKSKLQLVHNDSYIVELSNQLEINWLELSQFGNLSKTLLRILTFILLLLVTD